MQTRLEHHGIGINPARWRRPGQTEVWPKCHGVARDDIIPEQDNRRPTGPGGTGAGRLLCVRRAVNDSLNKSVCRDTEDNRWIITKQSPVCSQIVPVCPTQGMGACWRHPTRRHVDDKLQL